jgi:hypothetical protein
MVAFQQISETHQAITGQRRVELVQLKDISETEDKVGGFKCTSHSSNQMLLVQSWIIHRRDVIPTGVFSDHDYCQILHAVFKGGRVLVKRFKRDNNSEVFSLYIAGDPRSLLNTPQLGLPA